MDEVSVFPIFLGTFHHPKKNDGNPRALTPEPQKIKAFIGFHREFFGTMMVFSPLFSRPAISCFQQKRCLDPRHQILSMEAISEYVSLAQVLAKSMRYSEPTTYPASGLRPYWGFKKRFPTPLKFKMDNKHYDEFSICLTFWGWNQCFPWIRPY